MSKQNILHISAHSFRGGCEKNCYHFIKSTPNFNHSVVVLGDGGPMVSEWEFMGIKVSVLHLLNLNIFAFGRRIQREFPDDKFEKIILWTNIRLPVVLFALNKYKLAEVFVHIGNPLRSGIKSKLKNLALALFLPVRNSVYLRPVSEFVELSLRGDGYYAKYPSRVCLKPIQSNVERINPVSALTTESEIKIGMTARLDIIKDHKTVLRAMVRIRQQYPGATLYLIGDGHLQKSLREMTDSLGLGDHVIFCGDTENIYSIMKEWHLFVYATTRLEGLGGTVPEALSMGMPVIASALPMIREWDKGGKFIKFCNPYDMDDLAAKVIALLGDVDRRKFIYENAPYYISSNFSPHRFSASFLERGPLKDRTAEDQNENVMAAEIRDLNRV